MHVPHAFSFELGVVSEEISPAKHEHVNIQTPFPDKALASFTQKRGKIFPRFLAVLNRVMEHAFQAMKKLFL